MRTAGRHARRFPRLNIQIKELFVNKHTESEEFNATAEQWASDGKNMSCDESPWLLGSLRFTLPGAQDEPQRESAPDPAWWLDFLRVVRQSPRTPSRPPQPSTSRRPQPRSRTPRQPCRRQARTAQEPGDSDGDPDPVEARVRQLVDQAPPFSPGQRQLLGRLLGGGGR